ncbi:MAG: D-xylose ABC transporter ATP-binding protein [Spirochaetaceae bacterium 4572_59]|nr:MAG: D-xylose ABC transporter ATP-binding protein [Spirochaetaceae bacterium 4572_59]
MRAENSVLTVKKMTKRFQGTTALKEVSMELFNQEILAIMGENGAGKSTLMKILSGLYPGSETEGSIFLHGEEVLFESPIDSENMGIAMIYQELNLELDLSVTENICLGRLPLNKVGLIDWQKAEVIAVEALERLNLTLDMAATVRNLSPSMQQLICIARALVRNPSILILDEPTSVLTSSETDMLMEIINHLKEQGMACIYISHKLDEVYKLCDRIVILRDGYYISQYLKQEGYDSERIIEDMIGRKLNVMYPSIEKTIGEEVLRIEELKVPHTSAYGKDIIEDVSFNLHRGEILGLCGLVGSGRSETINAIFGSIPRTNGKIIIEGKEVNINSTRDAMRNGVGLLTEDRKKNGFIGTMSISHNMTLTILEKIKKLFLIDRKKESEKARYFFEKLSIKAPGLETLISSLSGGNQQKVILSKWLLTDLKILMLDEPTRGIDVGSKSEIYKIINNLAKEGVSIIVISSEISELLAICDRFVVLGHGVVQTELSKEDASEMAILRASSNT